MKCRYVHTFPNTNITIELEKEQNISEGKTIVSAGQVNESQLFVANADGEGSLVDLNTFAKITDNVSL